MYYVFGALRADAGISHMKTLKFTEQVRKSRNLHVDCDVTNIQVIRTIESQ